MCRACPPCRPRDTLGTSWRREWMSGREQKSYRAAGMPSVTGARGRHASADWVSVPEPRVVLE